jgi:hypothetical protein
MVTVDSQNNVWMTDVALHQVFKFGPYGGAADHKPLIVLGERFVPGSDDKSVFCNSFHTTYTVCILCKVPYLYLMYGMY